METNKRYYTRPKVIRIEIDKEIALQLASNPPEGPEESQESQALRPEYFGNDPFRSFDT